MQRKRPGELVQNAGKAPGSASVSPRRINLLAIHCGPTASGPLKARVDESGFDCVHVGSLEDGLTAFADGGFDATLIDLGAAGTGDDVLWKTVEAFTATAPVIVITDLDSEEIAERVFKAGAQDYIARSAVTGQLLKTAIRHAINRQEITRRTAQDRDNASALAVRQSVLARVGRLVSSTGDLSDVYPEITRELSRVLRFDRIAIHLVDWEAGEFTVEHVGGDRSEADEPGLRIPLAGTRTEAAALSEEATVITRADMIATARTLAVGRWPLDHGYIRTIGAPLIAHNRRLGVVFATSRIPGLDTPENLALLRDVADHIAGAIGQMMAHRETVEVVRKQEVIKRIGELLSSVDDLDEVFDQLSVEIGKLLPFDRIVMTLLSSRGDEFEQVLVHGGKDTMATPRALFPLEGSATLAALNSDKGVVLSPDDVRSMLGERSVIANTLLDQGFKHFAIAPLISGRRAVGALHLNSRSENGYGDKELDLLCEIASHIAGTVAQFVSKRDAREVAETQSALASLGRALTQSLDLEKVLRNSVPHIRKLLPSDSLALNLLNDDGETFRVQYLRGKAVMKEPNDRRRLKGSATGHVVRTKNSLSLDEDLRRPAGKRKFALSKLADHDIRSALMAPLIVSDEPIGAIMWLDRAPDKFSGPSTDIATTIATQLAGAIANAQLYQSTLQLAKETEERLRLEAENEQLEVANDMKEQILSNVSHELRTPLTSMVAFADVLHRNKPGNLTDRQLGQANVIRRGGRQLELIINDLLTMSRLSAGSFTLVKAGFDLRTVVDDVARMMQPVLEAKRQRMEVNMPPGVIEVTADEGRTGQVLCNLVSNASKYSPQDTVITVEVGSDDGETVISVSDQGPGIPEDQRESIFSRYYRVDNDTTRAEAGVGLGLHIVRSLVEAHGGRIEVGSASESGGAKMTVRLPAGA